MIVKGFSSCAGLLRLVIGQRRRRVASIHTVVMHAVVTVLILAGLLSCAAYRVAAPGDAKLAEGATRAHRARVAGYTTNDGRYHRFDGYLIHTADSLVFVPAFLPPEHSLVLPRDQVVSVRLDEGVSLPRSVLFGMSLLGFLALMIVATGGMTLGPFW